MQAPCKEERKNMLDRERKKDHAGEREKHVREQKKDYARKRKKKDVNETCKRNNEYMRKKEKTCKGKKVELNL